MALAPVTASYMLPVLVALPATLMPPLPPATTARRELGTRCLSTRDDLLDRLILNSTTTARQPLLLIAQ